MVPGVIHNAGEAFSTLLSEVLNFLPLLVVAAFLLIIGYFIAKAVRELMTRALRALHFDDVANRAGITRALRLAGTQLDAARVLADIVFWWIFLVFIELAMNTLGLVQISAFLNAVLGYIPNVIAAVLIVVIGALLARVVADVIRGAAAEAGLSTASLLADVARWAIIIFAVLAALTQLNVAPNMIFIFFAALMAMFALAGGLAFGLGGVDAARGLISGLSMGRMLQPGQRVRIGNEMGTVIRHDMNTTVVDTDHGQISIPNNALASEHITMLGSDGQQQRTPAGTV
jgi:small-conductance mechanosensitive channel